MPTVEPIRVRVVILENPVVNVKTLGALEWESRSRDDDFKGMVIIDRIFEVESKDSTGRAENEGPLQASLD